MRTTRKAAKAWEPETTTTAPSRYARDIILNDTLSPARSRGGISGVYERSSWPSQSDLEGSIWGWANRHRWTSEHGYELVEDED